jgi:hypothetical protein
VAVDPGAGLAPLDLLLRRQRGQVLAGCPALLFLLLIRLHVLGPQAGQQAHPCPFLAWLARAGGQPGVQLEKTLFQAERRVFSALASTNCRLPIISNILHAFLYFLVLFWWFSTGGSGRLGSSDLFADLRIKRAGSHASLRRTSGTTVGKWSGIMFLRLLLLTCCRRRRDPSPIIGSRNLKAWNKKSGICGYCTPN